MGTTMGMDTVMDMDMDMDTTKTKASMIRKSKNGFQEKVKINGLYTK